MCWVWMSWFTVCVEYGDARIAMCVLNFTGNVSCANWWFSMEILCFRWKCWDLFDKFDKSLISINWLKFLWFRWRFRPLCWKSHVFSSKMRFSFTQNTINLQIQDHLLECRLFRLAMTYDPLANCTFSTFTPLIVNRSLSNIVVYCIMKIVHFLAHFTTKVIFSNF